MQNKMNPFIFYAEVPPVFASSAKIDNLSQKKIINSHVLFNLAQEYTHSRTMCIRDRSFPAMGMHPVLQALANLFPLRHYFLIYVDQALNGYPMIYSWVNYVALLIFMMLPFLIACLLSTS